MYGIERMESMYNEYMKIVSFEKVETAWKLKNISI